MDPFKAIFPIGLFFMRAFLRSPFFTLCIIDVYVNVNRHRTRRQFMQIQDRVFIVTGGASGLGEGTARMLAANGGKVVLPT
jgi:hypothetical protein